MNIRDISFTLTDIINLLVQCFSFCFKLLSEITFFGTNLLSFILSVFIIGGVFSLLFSVVRTYSVNRIQSEASSRFKSRGEKEDPKK